MQMYIIPLRTNDAIPADMHVRLFANVEVIWNLHETFAAKFIHAYRADNFADMVEAMLTLPTSLLI